MTRQQEAIILRLWRSWCRIWPEQYGHESLEVGDDGYDPVFDVIPGQAYKDFYYEVVLDHPDLKGLNAFEVIDAALNQTRAPESANIVRPGATARVAQVSLPDTEQPPEARDAGAA